MKQAMQLSKIENQIITTMHDLPFDQQRSILEFSLFLKSLTSSSNKNKSTKRKAGLGVEKSWLSDDFNNELPDGFWFAEEQS